MPVNDQYILKLAGQLMVDLLIEEAIRAGVPQSMLPLPPRTHRGTNLSQSNLVRLNRIRAEFTTDKATIIMPQYVVYIEEGRRPSGNLTSNKPEAQGALGFNEFQNRRPPLRVILDQMRRKGIAAGRNNSVVFAIMNAIAQRGIKGRPFVERAINKYFSSAAGLLTEELYNQIIEQINFIRQ